MIQVNKNKKNCENDNISELQIFVFVLWQDRDVKFHNFRTLTVLKYKNSWGVFRGYKKLQISYMT